MPRARSPAHLHLSSWLLNDAMQSSQHSSMIATHKNLLNRRRCLIHIHNTFILVAEQVPGYLKLDRAKKSEAVGADHCFAAIQSMLASHKWRFPQQDLPLIEILHEQFHIHWVCIIMGSSREPLFGQALWCAQTSVAYSPLPLAAVERTSTPSVPRVRMTCNSFFSARFHTGQSARESAVPNLSEIAGHFLLGDRTYELLNLSLQLDRHISFARDSADNQSCVHGTAFEQDHLVNRRLHGLQAVNVGQTSPQNLLS